MTQVETAPKKEQYNQTAVRTSEALEQAREAIRSEFAGVERTREQIFPPYNRPGLGVALEYERMGDRPVSESLQSRADKYGFEFEHLGITLGTVIHGIDLRRADSTDQMRFVRDVLLERKVIFFRDQNLAEDEQVRFARCFGDLDAFPFGPTGQNPYVLEIRHGRSHPGMENGWHTDVTWMENPSLGSIAQCIEVPPRGGATLF